MICYHHHHPVTSSEDQGLPEYIQKKINGTGMFSKLTSVNDSPSQDYFASHYKSDEMLSCYPNEYLSKLKW